MANVTAAMVKDLREKTGAGMMDCKNALNEVGGDIEGAIDWLRKKGLSKAAKKSGRIAAEGLIAVAIAGTSGVVVELNSETDFVARNDDFQALARHIAVVAVTTGTTEAAALSAAAYPGGGTVADGLGKIGVIVALESTGSADALNALARMIALHVAATGPLALDSSGLDPAVVAREKAVLADKNAGKPPHVLEKITESGLKTYFKEVCLLDQPSIHADHANKTIGQVVKEAEKSVGAPVTLTGFVRYALGEGIERQESDFAAEVAAAASGGV